MLVTAPDEESAATLCRTLVDERLIACGNIVRGVRSIYRWQGRVQDESEVLLVLKTVRGNVSSLLERIPLLHPYDVPEVLVLRVESGHGAYMEWVARQSGSDG